MDQRVYISLYFFLFDEIYLTNMSVCIFTWLHDPSDASHTEIENQTKCSFRGAVTGKSDNEEDQQGI